MRLYEIESNPTPSNLDDIWHNHILKECTDALHLFKANPNKFFYRGFYDSAPEIFKDTPRTDRKPKDSILWVSELFDIALTKLGHKALRSNSIFVTSAFETAERYGTPYYIFPVNGYDYTWTKWRDIVLNINEAEDILDSDLFDTIVHDPNFNHGEVFKKGVSLEQFKESLNKLFKGGISLDDDNIIDLQKFVEKFQPSKDHIQKPLQSQREICIRGAYYAINCNRYRTQIEAYVRML